MGADTDTTVAPDRCMANPHGRVNITWDAHQEILTDFIDSPLPALSEAEGWHSELREIIISQ